MLDRIPGRASLLEQVGVVGPQMIQAKLVGGLAEVLCELLHEAQIVAGS